MTSQTVKMLKVTTEGKVSIVEVPHEGGLRILQGHVGGLIEHVRIGEGFSMWVNEEGLLEAQPKVNVLPSLLYGMFIHRQPICGDVLIFADDPSGEHDFVDDPDLAVKVLQLVQERLKEATFH